MPTSCTRISDRTPRHRQGGFTLLELLVVVVMVAILMGTVVLGFTGADTEQRLRGSAEQLAYTIEIARQYALQRNREWGLYVAPDGIEIVEFDPDELTWVSQAGRPFDSVELPANVRLWVESEGFEQLADDGQEDLPQVILFSSGEVTPFTLYLEPEWDVAGWEIRSDGLSRSRATRTEF